MTVTGGADISALPLWYAGRLWQAILAQQDRWFLLSPLCLAAGIWIWCALPYQPVWWPSVLLVSGCLAAWRIADRHVAGRLLAMMALLVAAGFALAHWRTHTVSAPLLQKQLRYVQAEGQVRSMELQPGGVRLVLQDPVIGGLTPEQTPQRIRLVVKSRKHDIRPGDYIRLPVRLFPLPRPVIPGGYDYGRQLWFDGLQATGYGFGITARQAATDWPGIAITIAAWRYQVAVTIRHAFDHLQETGWTDRDGGLAIALLTGQRGLLSGDEQQAMRDSGLAHLLAISGLHIGLVSGLVFFFLRACLALVPYIALHWPVKKWAAIAGWLAALVYWQLAGATVPTERAFIMASVFFAAILVDRQALSVRVVMIAAMVILVLRPESLLNAGFHMSFAATLALVGVAEYWRQRQRFRQAMPDDPVRRFASKGMRYAGGIIATSLIAGLATGPIAAWHFGHMAHYGLLANMLAVPLTGLWVMPSGLLALIAMPFGLETVPLAMMAYGLDAVVAIARAVAGLPGATGRLAGFSGWVPLCLAMALVMAVTWRRGLRWLALPFVVMAASAFFILPPQRATILVAEEGDHILIGADPPLLWLDDVRPGWLAGRWAEAFGYEAEDLILLPTIPGTASPDVMSIPGSAPGSALSLQDWRCDTNGCSGQLGLWRLSVARHVSALRTDCARADILIATIPVRGACNNPVLIIDRFDLWRHGNHAIHFDPGPQVTRADDDRRYRPWSSSPPDRYPRKTPARHETPARRHHDDDRAE